MVTGKTATNKGGDPKQMAISFPLKKGDPTGEPPAKPMMKADDGTTTMDTSSDATLDTPATPTDAEPNTAEKDTAKKPTNKETKNTKNTNTTNKHNDPTNVENANEKEVIELEQDLDEEEEDTNTMEEDQTMSDEDSMTENKPSDGTLAAAATKVQASLAAATQELTLSPVSNKFHFEIQVKLHGSDEATIETEIRQAIDRILELARSLGINVSLFPLHEPDGPPIKRMSNPSTSKITFAKDTKDSKEEKLKKALPKFGSYTTGWLKKPKDFPHQNVPLHAQIDCAIEKFVSVMSMRLVARNMVLFPYRISTFNETDYRGIGLVLPAYQAVDFFNLQFFFLSKHKVHVDFKPVKRLFSKDGKDQGFGMSRYKDTDCVGHLLICEPHATRKVMKLVQEYFPTRTRSSLEEYPLHIKLSIFLLNGSGVMSQNTLEKIPNLFSTSQLDYEHSKFKPPKGGLLAKKLLANVDSLHVPIKDKYGKLTTLRQFLMSRKDPMVPQKPRFGAICPAPTAGNKGSCHTLFTTYRSGSEARSTQLADRASQYASLEMCGEIWDNFSPSALESVLAPILMDDLAMDHAVVLEELPSGEAENEFLEDDIEEVDLRSMDSRLAPTTTSELTGVTAKTTQSTRDKLSASQAENDSLRQQLEAAKAATALVTGEMAPVPPPPANTVQTETSSDQPSSAETPPEKDLIAEEPPDDSAQDSAPPDLKDATTCASAAMPDVGNG